MQYSLLSFLSLTLLKGLQPLELVRATPRPSFPSSMTTSRMSPFKLINLNVFSKVLLLATWMKLRWPLPLMLLAPHPSKDLDQDPSRSWFASQTSKTCSQTASLPTSSCSYSCDYDDILCWSEVLIPGLLVSCQQWLSLLLLVLHQRPLLIHFVKFSPAIECLLLAVTPSAKANTTNTNDELVSFDHGCFYRGIHAASVSYRQSFQSWMDSCPQFPYWWWC